MPSNSDYQTSWDIGASTRRWVDTNILGLNSKPASTYAADTYAQITRDQWANYVKTFVPIENQLIQYATDSTQPQQAMDRAHASVESAYTAQAGATQRRLTGLGVSLNQDEQQAQTRATGLSKSLADVGSQNIASALTRQQQMGIMGNPAPSVATAGG